MLRVLSGWGASGSRATTAGIGSMGSITDGSRVVEGGNVFRVLFCGEEFAWGYRFSKEALQYDPAFEASPSCFPRLPDAAHVALWQMLARGPRLLCCSI